MHTRSQGFTLVELLVVIAIIGVLAAILIPSYSGAQKRSWDSAALQCGRELVKASVAYKAERGSFPAAPHSPNVLGEDVQEVCTGVRVMAYSSPTTRTGTDYTISGYNSAITFLVAHNNGSGIYAFNVEDTYCAGGCRLKYIPWSAYGL